MDALAKLSAATTALAEARTLDEVTHIRDMAEAARTYARAAKLGLEAQNHAAEIKLRAERKAGELLADLERGKTGPKTELDSIMESNSPYRQVLTENDIAPTTAHRWQTVAELPDELFEEHIAEIKSNGQELTTTGVAQVAQGWKRMQSEPHDWTDDQLRRKEQVLNGETVLANQRRDHALIAWAQENGLYERIDRATKWGNPFEIDKDGDRKTVVLKYEDFYFLKESLWPHLKELVGKVLGCWCCPDYCHGEVLLNFMRFDHDEPGQALGFGPPVGGPEDIRLSESERADWDFHYYDDRPEGTRPSIGHAKWG